LTDHYAVIGNPIAQSLSPTIHAEFARATGQDLEYGRLEAPLDGFAAAVDAFRKRGGRGMNVTAPFKLDAFGYATKLRERAQLAGAVNCLKFDGDQVEAENFDGIALRRDVEQNLSVRLRGKRVLLLGAGGATRGALLPFLEAGPSALVVANRTAEKAAAIGREFGERGPLATMGADQLADAGTFDLVLNATSASLREELPELPASVFTPDSVAYELAYGKGLTPFLHLARECGVTRLYDGVGMLVEQAAEAFLWWRQVRPETRGVIELLTVPLV
jgi:shikimate dehydrogenase